MFDVSILSVDLPEDKQEKAVELAKNNLQEQIKKNDGDLKKEKDLDKVLARSLKESFDQLYGQHWNVIVGSGFGSAVVHQSSHYIYFTVDEKAFLIFKS